MDIEILNWINENLHNSNFVNHLFKLITHLGDYLTIFACLGFVLLFFKNTRKKAIILLLGICFTALVGVILKVGINRPRPFVENIELARFIKGIGLKFPTSASFPSGHTLICFASATMLTLLFGKVGAWSFILASLIAFSRIFLCLHYLTDVIGGIIIGSICGVLCVVVAKRLFKFIFRGKLQ